MKFKIHFQQRGNQAALAKHLGISEAQVNQWVHAKRPIPVTYGFAIERFTDGKVKRQDLRPNDYWLIWPDLKAPKAKE